MNQPRSLSSGRSWRLVPLFSGAQALAALVVLLAVIGAIPYAEMALIIPQPGLCTPGWLLLPVAVGGLQVPLSFVVDALLLLPTCAAAWRAFHWLKDRVVSPREWRSYVATLGCVLVWLSPLAAIGWAFAVGWWVVDFACVWPGF